MVRRQCQDQWRQRIAGDGVAAGIGAVLSALFLGEAIHAWQWVGFGCVVVAIVIAFRGGGTPAVGGADSRKALDKVGL